MFRILVAEDDESTRLLMCEVCVRRDMSRARPATAWRRWR